jgi:hypothetical protein
LYLSVCRFVVFMSVVLFFLSSSILLIFSEENLNLVFGSSSITKIYRALRCVIDLIIYTWRGKSLKIYFWKVSCLVRYPLYDQFLFFFLSSYF